MKQDKLRWQYRFDNFKKSYLLLQEAIEFYNEGKMEQLAKEGMIQRFEICMELAWKVMKDYLEYNGIIFKQVIPTAVIKEAIESKLIENGDNWMAALAARNKTSHIYSFDNFNKILDQIANNYFKCFEQLYETLLKIYK